MSMVFNEHQVFVLHALRLPGPFKNPLSWYARACELCQVASALGLYYKTLTSVILKFSQYARVFGPGKPFQPSLMFVGKASNPPQSGASFRCSAHEGSVLDRKPQSWLVRHARNKHFRFLRTFVKYERIFGITMDSSKVFFLVNRKKNSFINELSLVVVIIC